MGQLMARRVMQVLSTGRPIGAVEFDGKALTFEGMAASVLGFLRSKVGDDIKFGRDLMDDGWMNQAVQLGPLEQEPSAVRSSAPGEPHHYKHGWIPIDGLDGLSDDELLDHFHQLSQADVPDETALHALDAELARREDAPFDSPESRRVDDLVAKGHGYLDAYAEVHGLDVAKLELEQRMQRVDQERRPGETRAQTIRRMHAEHVAVAVLQAEDDTHGNLLNREGRAAGIDPATLWSGPTARARKYASDELKQWWSEHGGRMTAAQWAAQFTGDTKAAEAARLAGQGKDFGV